jgi:hypothetical protein
MAKKQVTKSEKAATVPAETPKASTRTRKTATPAPVEVAADAPRPARARKAAAAGAPAPAIPSSSPAAPTAEQIATRAYFRFLERGGVAGNELEDWFAAEADLLARLS